MDLRGCDGDVCKLNPAAGELIEVTLKDGRMLTGIVTEEDGMWREPGDPANFVIVPDNPAEAERFADAAEWSHVAWPERL